MGCHLEGPSKAGEVSHGNLMKFSEAKCKVLQLGWAMPAINTGWDRKELRADLWKRIWMSSALG